MLTCYSEYRLIYTLNLLFIKTFKNKKQHQQKSIFLNFYILKIEINI